MAWGPSIGLPSLYQWILGVGLPVAEHVRDILSFSFTFSLEGALVTKGASRLSTTEEYYIQNDASCVVERHGVWQINENSLTHLYCSFSLCSISAHHPQWMSHNCTCSLGHHPHMCHHWGRGQEHIHPVLVGTTCIESTHITYNKH